MSRQFIGVAVEAGAGVLVGVLVDVLVAVLVGVFVDVLVAVFVGVFVAVFVAVLVDVGVAVSVGVLVAVLVGVFVGVSVGVLVAVFVGVSVAVLVAVFVGVSVGVFVAVLVAVCVGVSVAVLVGVCVEVAVGSGGMHSPASHVSPSAQHTSSQSVSVREHSQRRRLVESGGPQTSEQQSPSFRHTSRPSRQTPAASLVKLRNPLRRPMLAAPPAIARPNRFTTSRRVDAPATDFARLSKREPSMIASLCRKGRSVSALSRKTEQTILRSSIWYCGLLTCQAHFRFGDCKLMQSRLFD